MVVVAVELVVCDSSKAGASKNTSHDVYDGPFYTHTYGLLWQRYTRRRRCVCVCVCVELSIDRPTFLHTSL